MRTITRMRRDYFVPQLAQQPAHPGRMHRCFGASRLPAIQTVRTKIKGKNERQLLPSIVEDALDNQVSPRYRLLHLECARVKA
jgi:hypothetical protein